MGVEIVSSKNSSAEIFELDGARARLRSSDLDPSNFLTVGSYLEAVREKLGLSITMVSERTHIKSTYIEAIEQMAVKDLPSKPFAIGFVRVYAEALGLDAAAIVERFKNDAGYSGQKKEATTEPTPAAAPPSAETGELARLSLLAVLAILAFMIWCAYLVTRPDPSSIKTPLKLDGALLVEGPLQARLVPDAPVPEEALPGVSANAPVGQTSADAGSDFRPAVVPPLPVVVEAALVDRIEPVYPPACETEAAPAETVEVAFTVSPTGAVVSERIAASSNPCFERAALNAVKRWRFTPRTIDGSPRPAYEQKAAIRFDRPS